MQIDSDILTREQSNVVVRVATSLFGPPSTLDNCCKTSLIGLRRSGTKPLISPVCLSVCFCCSKSIQMQLGIVEFELNVIRLLRAAA